MDHNLADKESLIALVQQLERERDELRKDIEQLCMHQAGPAYLGVATRMHFQRTAGLEQEVENLKKKLASCTRENQNLQEELSEAYRIKSQLADLLTAEVSKNVEAEKQLKFFQGCVAAAFAERDNAIMEAEKAKEKEELMPQELNKIQRKVEELTSELVEEKGLVTTLRIDLEKQNRQNEVFKEVIDKFYDLRQCSMENFTDASCEEKCDCLLNDSAEMWRFQDDEETSTAVYISSLEAEIDTLRKGVNNLQHKLRVGLEFETHLKKKVSDLEKNNILSEDKIKKQISTLLHYHSQCRMDITNLLDEGYSELQSIIDLVVEKIKQFELSGEHNSKSHLTQDTELRESECRDVHMTADSDPDSNTKSSDPGFPTSSIPASGDTSEALAQALQEKVAALLLLSQQEERYLLEGNVNAALQKKVEELQRNLLQVTNEKVKALMELAQLKQERYSLQETGSEDVIQGKHLSEIQERRNLQEKDGKLKSFLRRTYLPSWAGGSFGHDAESQVNYEKSNSHMDFARMKIENATLKESLESMEHLLSSVRRLRISLLKIKDSTAAESAKAGCHETLDKTTYETKLLKTALSSSLPSSWSAETSGSCTNSVEVGLDPDYEKVDFVSRCGFEMVELLIFATTVLKDQISDNIKEMG